MKSPDDPITEDELLYRAIDPNDGNWYKKDEHRPTRLAFIDSYQSASVTRAALCTCPSQGKLRPGDYVCGLVAQTVLEHAKAEDVCVNLLPDKTAANSGHALIHIDPKAEKGAYKRFAKLLALDAKWFWPPDKAS